MQIYRNVDFLEDSNTVHAGKIGLAQVGSMLPPNTRIAHYQIRSLLGKGGMGEVYLAQDTTLKRLVAIKLLPPDLIQNPTRVRRFHREAYAASSLNHPNILTIYEIGEDDDRHFIASEYVQGQSLRARMALGRIPLKEIVNIVMQAAAGLAAAEREGIVHRDIKPENLMLRTDGYVKILDFGLAKLTEQRRENDEPDLPDEAITVPMTETFPGTVVGTTLYMSPEQARGLEIDSRSDIWSLGVVFYEMLAGRVPFDGATSSDVLAAILKTEPEPLKDFMPELSNRLTEVVGKMLQKDREHRYQSCAEVLVILEQLHQQMQTSPADYSAEFSDGEGASAITARLKSTNENQPTVRHNVSNTYGRLAAPPRSRRLKILIVVGAFAMIVTAAYFLFSYQPTKSITSVAVLPFVNGSVDDQVDYLADGVSENILDQLSQVPDLKVINRTSSFKYKGKDADPQQVAKLLGVEALVMGRLVKRGDDVEIRVELVDGRDKTQLWGGQYIAKAADLPQMQNQICRKLQEKLGFSSANVEVVPSGATPDEELYQLYLKGRYSWNKLTRDGLDQSIVYFNQAIQKNPNYALAHAGLANAYLVLGANYLSPQDTFPKAEEAAKQALALDDTLAEAHYAMAATKFFYYWNFPETEKELRRTLELNPNYSNAYNLKSTLHLAKGQTNEAISEAKRALDLDPFSLLFNNKLSTAYYYARDYGAALEQIKKTMQMDAQATFLHNDMCMVYAQLGRYDEAVAECQKVIILQKDDPAALATLAVTYGLRGRRSEAEWILGTLDNMQKTKYVSPFFFASIYAALGNKDETFAWLKKAKAERSFIIFLAIDPLFDKIRSDSRYIALMQDMPR
jgi:serine/threonine protein kinase/tetratricopeptide (TPR) repeat protein